RRIGMHQRCQADAAIADDDGRDALADLRQHLRRGQHDLVVVRMHVDKAPRHDLTGDVLHNCVLRRQVRADCGDAIAFDAHIGGEAWRAGAVDDRAALEDDRAISSIVHDDCTSPLDQARSRTGCVSLSTPRSCSTCRTRFNWRNAGGPRRKPVPTISISTYAICARYASVPTRIDGSAGTTTGRTTSARSASGVSGRVMAMIIAPCSFATSTVSSKKGIRPICEIANATSCLFIVAAETSCRCASK